MAVRSWIPALVVVATVLGAVGPEATAGDDPAVARRLLDEDRLDLLFRLARRRALRGQDEDHAWDTVAGRLRHAERMEPHERLEQVAHVARDLGMHEVALQRWDRFFRAMPALRDRDRLRWAATDAVELSRFDEAAALLRDAGPETAGRASMVEAYAASDRSLAARARFARDFWLSEGEHWRVSWAPRAAILLLLPSLEKADATPAAEDFELAYRAALLAFRDGAARRVLALWKDRFPVADVVGRAMRMNADLSGRHRRGSPEIDATLLEVLPDAPVPPDAIVAAAAVLRDRGSADRAERLLRSVLDRAKGAPDADAEVRDRARLVLARILEEAGRHAEARVVYTAWEGRGSDGRAGATLAERALAIARCLVAEGRPDEAIEAHLLPHYGAREVSPASEGVSAALVDFHVALEAGRGRLATLEAALGNLRQPDAAAVALARGLASMHRAAERSDRREVLEIGLRLSEGDMLNRVVATDDRMPAPLLRAGLLLDAGPEVLDVIRGAFDRATAGPGRDGARRGALVALLRRHPHAGATAILEALAARAESGEDLGVDPVVLAEALEHRLLFSE